MEGRRVTGQGAAPANFDEDAEKYKRIKEYDDDYVRAAFKHVRSPREVKVMKVFIYTNVEKYRYRSSLTVCRDFPIPAGCAAAGVAALSRRASEPVRDDDGEVEEGRREARVPAGPRGNCEALRGGQPPCTVPPLQQDFLASG
jgi:hypothetical protein